MQCSSHRLTSLGFLAWTSLFTLIALIAVCLLPHSRHVRFISVHDSAVVKAGWIYERIHIDPTPTDIVFIGSSHTVFGVDAHRVADNLGTATGRPVHVVNFGMQHLGRDLPWLLAREVLQTKPVKVLVIEVQEDEPRSLHPAFGSIANAADIVTAPLIINTDYWSDLTHLPLRQARLFRDTILRAIEGTPDDAPQLGYLRPDWDDTYIERHAVGAAPRTAIHTAAELEAERVHFDRMTAQKSSLPGPLARFESRANLIYLQEIIDLADKQHVQILFLYMPNYDTVTLPRFVAVYSAHGPVLFPRDLYRHLEYWQDIAHLNHNGAEALADWLGKQPSLQGWKFPL